MTDVDQLRADLYRDTSTFLELLKGKDRSTPALRDEALVRIQTVFRYATVDGRRRFLDAMKRPGADKDRRRAFDVCRKSGKDEATCRAEAEKLPLFRDIFDAYPPTNTLPAWYAAPITNLIGTYDPANPPSDALKDWHDTLRADDPELAALLEGADAVSAASEEIADSLASAFEPGPEPEPGIPWWKVGAAVAGAVLVGAVAYRIARRPA
ncbi:MAG: hypothetical protein H6711_35205 [Myxococcales bacterium]|nr:hypothetical protein [Myxococcales bacterium]